MSYSKVFNVYWFCPPRTGSRATSEIRKYLSFESKHHQLPDLDTTDYYFVSNIRNPYSRAVSLFHLIFSQYSDKTKKDFKKFLEKKIIEENNGIIYSNTLFYLSISNVYKKINKQPDSLVRLENVVEDVNNLWFVKDNYNGLIDSAINENLKINKYSFEFSSKPHWTEYYDEETSEFLYNNLKDDFEIGGYSKDSWKSKA